MLDRQLAYWRKRLAGASPLGLPTDRPRPPLRTFNGAHLLVPLAPPLGGALRRRRQRRAAR